MAASSRILTYKIPWTGDWWATAMKSKESDTTEDAYIWLFSVIFYLLPFYFLIKFHLFIVNLSQKTFPVWPLASFSILVSKFTCSLQIAFELCSEFPFLVHVFKFERHRGCTGI